MEKRVENKKRKEKSIVLKVRVDIVGLAHAILNLNDMGIRARSRSTLVGIVVEAFRKIVENSRGEDRRITPEEAWEILDKYYPVEERRGEGSRSINRKMGEIIGSFEEEKIKNKMEEFVNLQKEINREEKIYKTEEEQYIEDEVMTALAMLERRND